jgi:hypothetical protein
MTNRYKLSELASRISACERAITEWPFETQGVFDAAQTEITELEHQAWIQADQIKDKALIETVRIAVAEGEYGEQYTNEHGGEDRASFWLAVSAMAQAIGE